MTTAYLRLDLHARTCTFGIMKGDGTFLGHRRFPTSEWDLIPRVVGVDASPKRLALEEQLRTLYRVLDTTVEIQTEAKKCRPRLGRRCGGIQEFQKMPGVGPIGSHVFDAFIKTPHHFFGQAEALVLLPRH